VNARAGLIVPSSNTVVEQEVARTGRAGSVHVARVRVTEISLTADALAQFGAGPMTAAASLLGDARVAAVAWAGTSGSWLGTEHDRRIADAMSAAAGAPATTSTLALLAACRAAGMTRIGLITPYIPAVVARITATFAAAGVTVTGESHLGLTDNHAFAGADADTLVRMASACAAGAQGLVVLCTNMAGAPAAARMSEATGLPVLDSVTVTLNAVEALARRPGLIGESCGS
jgi:maleate isomerase